MMPSIKSKALLPVLVLLSALGAGCGDDNDGEPTPPIPPLLDLYIVPSAAEGGWHVALEGLALSTDPENPSQLSLPGGGVTRGAVYQPLSEDAEEPEPEPSRVLAYKGDGLVFTGLPEGGDFNQNFNLRTTEGLYDLWVEPLNTRHPPLWLESVPLPDEDGLVLTVPVGETLSGQLWDPVAEQGIVAATITTLNPSTLRRSGGIVETGSGGAFSLQTSLGPQLLVVQRQGRGASTAEAEPKPIPLTQVASLEVLEGGEAGIFLELTPPETQELTGSVSYLEETIPGVEVVATRISESSPFGDLMVTVESGIRSQLTPGVFVLPLPEGLYSLKLTPPEDVSVPLAPLLFQGGEPLSMFGASLGDPITLTPLLTDLRGELGILQETGGAQGTSLLFIPETNAEPPISAQARAGVGAFVVGIEPPGQQPITLSEGSPTLELLPPLGSSLVKQSLSVNIRQGQSELSLPPMETGYRVYGSINESVAERFRNAVVKAVPQGQESWELKWGPGPDPRDVLAEGVIDAQGQFSLVLPYP